MEAGHESAAEGLRSEPADLRREIGAHRALFEQRYGPGAGIRCFYAPGRVNLMGAHLDYNGGPVMPLAIDRGTFIALRPRGDRKVRAATTGDPDHFECDLDTLPEASGNWVDYPFGVLVRLRERIAARAGVDLLFGGNLPVGAGLSSSASICVATALALDRAWELGLDPLERVRIALDAEREYVGVHCGIMDPYAVGLARPGHLLWLDCRDASFDFVPLDQELFTVAVCDSGVRRELAQGAFNQRVAECNSAFDKLRPAAPEATCLRDVPLEVLATEIGRLGEVEARRARHVLEEVRRTLAAREALLASDLAAFGGHMFAAHASLRELFEVSVPELDCLVEAAWQSGCTHGARLTGAGFGGCTANVLEPGSEEAFTQRVGEAFEAAFSRRPRIDFFAGDAGPREMEDPDASQ